VARAQGERGTGMSRFASRARRHSDPAPAMGVACPATGGRSDRDRVGVL
ncbi:MAG: hypothetical protein, partial [Olavius algarvensis Gamma 1 endosymbiont]